MSNTENRKDVPSALQMLREILAIKRNDPHKGTSGEGRWKTLTIRTELLDVYDAALDAQAVQPTGWTVLHNGGSVTGNTLFAAMKAAQSLRTEEEARIANENLLRALEEELAAPATASKEAELLPLPHSNYNGCGDGSEPLYTAEQMRDYAAACVESSTQPTASKPEQEPNSGE